MNTLQHVYIHNDLTNTERQNLIQNVFGATASRQRSLPVDEQIFRLQQHQCDYDLAESEYQVDLDALLE